MTGPEKTETENRRIHSDDEPDLSGWKPVFWIAAAYNISAATIALLAPDFHIEQFFGPATAFEGTVAHLNTQAFWVSVLLFGMGYAIVARNPERNHGILLLAALGKTYVFVVFTGSWLQGSMRPLALVGGIGDLCFAVIFVWFLWQVDVKRGRGWAG